tara:strand:+ start:36 stop:146 length:111 start_codon:yes stop_codon:yes gene_type:complete
LSAVVAAVDKITVVAVELEVLELIVLSVFLLKKQSQ